MSDLPEVQPEDEQSNEGGSSARRFVPWLIVLAIALLFVPLYLTSFTLTDTLTPLETESAMLDTTITAPPPVPAAEQTLTSHLLDLNGQLNAIRNVPPTLIAGHLDWPAIMTMLHSYDANKIRLTGLNHTNTRLTLSGNAIEENAVLDYSNALQQTGFFSRVQVQTITANGKPPPTPSIATPGAAVLTEIYMPFDFTLSVDLLGAGNGSR